MEQKQIVSAKAFTVAFFLISMIFLPIMVSQILISAATPKYMTTVYHFNAEYRAGTQEHEDTIIGKAVPALVEMYEDHPEWKWTLEFQGFAIEKMRDLNYSSFVKLRDQVNSGQCELISVSYGYPLVVAHPYNQTVRSIIYNRNLLQSLGFNKFSESVFFQESQTLPGFGQLNNPLYERYGIRFRNLLISTATLSLYGFSTASPLFRTQLNGDTETSFNYLTYNYLPLKEAGAFHAWTWVAPGETITGKNDWTLQGFNDMGFTPYPPNIEWHEERLTHLEANNYKFLTCDEWVEHCENRGAIRDIEKFLPETTWRASDSDSIWTWTGKNKNYGNDDGSQLAEIYRTGQYALGVENLINCNRSELQSAQAGLPSKLRNNVTEAWTHIFKAMGTDGVGWRPDYYESNYTRWHCANATQILEGVVTNITDTLSLSGRIQAINFNNSIKFSEFIAPINKTTGSLHLSDLPVDVEISTDKFNHNYSVSDMEFMGVNYMQLDIFADCPLQSEDVEFYLKFTPKDNDVYPIKYSPTLYENRSQTFSFDDYGRTLYLPQTNGFLWMDDVAIIKNCSSRHVSLQCNKNDLGYYEKGTNVETMHYQVFFLAGSEMVALNFANEINVDGVVDLA